MEATGGGGALAGSAIVYLLQLISLHTCAFWQTGMTFIHYSSHDSFVRIDWQTDWLIGRSSYDLTDPGGKAPLPADPNQFPWAGPLRARHSQLKGAVYLAPALSFAIVEL